MRKIAISALKGGVGKTTTSCGLAKALRDMGKKVGIAEIDITGSSVWKALGLSSPPELQTNSVNQTIIPSKIDGIEVFTIASCFKASTALMWKGRESVKGGQILKGTGKYELVKQILRDVAFSSDLDYLIYDCPPNVGEDILSLWENIPDIWGVIIITQPTSLSREGLLKTVDMLKFKKLPIAGVIINMDGVVCPHCQTKFNPFLDIENFEDLTLRVLGRIPFSNSLDLQTYYKRIAAEVEQVKMEKKEKTFFDRLSDQVTKAKKAAVTSLAPIVLKRMQKADKK